MNKFFLYSFLILFLTSCSLDKSARLWTEARDIKIENTKNTTILFEKDTVVLDKEFNASIKIKLSNKPSDNSFLNNLKNNNGRINFNSELQNISTLKFSKIKNFDNYEPEIIFHKDNIIFFDNKGSILKFDKFSNLIWKKNFYKKSEKKLNPILFFNLSDEKLVVFDNLAKYYSINVNTGELLWSKNNSSIFNSEVKIFNEKIFIIDFENTLRCFSLKDGSEIWKIKTEQTVIKSPKKLSLVVINENIYFSNSIGDITAVNINTGNLLWQTPTQNSSIFENYFSLENSNLITDNESIFFSNNSNQFFSLDVKTGIINWVQKINSTLRSTIVGNLIFSVTIEGFLVVLDKNNGNITRITDIFKEHRNNRKLKIKPSGFILGSSYIYLTTNNGRLLLVNIETGYVKKVIKIDNKKISRPLILNQSLYIIKDNGIIKLN